MFAHHSNMILNTQMKMHASVIHFGNTNDCERKLPVDAFQPTKNNHRRSWLRSLVICSKHCTTNDCESKDCPWMRFSRRKLTTGDLCSGLWSSIQKVNLRMRNGNEDQNNEMLSHSNMFVLTYASPHLAHCAIMVHIHASSRLCCGLSVAAAVAPHQN